METRQIQEGTAWRFLSAVCWLRANDGRLTAVPWHQLGLRRHGPEEHPYRLRGGHSGPPITNVRYDDGENGWKPKKGSGAVKNRSQPFWKTLPQRRG